MDVIYCNSVAGQITYLDSRKTGGIWVICICNFHRIISKVPLLRKGKARYEEIASNTAMNSISYHQEFGAVKDQIERLSVLRCLQPWSQSRITLTKSLLKYIRFLFHYLFLLNYHCSQLILSFEIIIKYEYFLEKHHSKLSFSLSLCSSFSLYYHPFLNSLFFWSFMLLCISVILECIPL